MSARTSSGILTGDYSFNAAITVRNPTSGFYFAIGESGAGGTFSESVAFSGYSGYVFDQEKDFVGGYKSGIAFQISGVVFGGSDIKMAYYINEHLIKNNVDINDSLNPDTIVFENYGSGILKLTLQERSTRNSTYLVSSDPFILESSNNFFFVTN